MDEAMRDISPPNADDTVDWWRGAVIYQIYLRSFRDTTGNGIGDLPGIIEKLDYLASLGVDAIWICPFYKSPMQDFGYDVSDYRAVDPTFGTLNDFDLLVDETHARGLKILIDLVIGHTSEQHAWFRESRRDRTNPQADWYVWADPNPDGTPPNNWLSVFGGPAWTWEPRRGQYYLHHFLPCQPHLDLHNPEVQAQMLEVAEFWLRRGVDGFRLDAAQAYFHDRDLRDDPPAAPGRQTPGVPAGNPYGLQRHVHSINRPESVGFFRRVRALLDDHPGTAAVAEIFGNESPSAIADYTKGSDRLHMAYTFDLLSAPLSAAGIREIVDTAGHGPEDGWPSWAFSNHDVQRAVSRLGGGRADAALAKLLMALLLSLRGSACIYQGEELGLPQAALSVDQLRDPYDRAFWPSVAGRDGSRTPMPWTAAAEHGGFSDTEPWLPVIAEHRARAVDRQDNDANSVLNAYRRFLAWRKNHPALRRGDIRFRNTEEPLLAFERRTPGERLVAVFNLDNEPRETALADLSDWRPIEGHGFFSERTNDVLRLPGFGAFFATTGN